MLSGGAGIEMRMGGNCGITVTLSFSLVGDIDMICRMGIPVSSESTGMIRSAKEQ